MATPVAKQLETVRAYESGNDIRQMVATSEGGRAYKLLKRREETRAAAEAEKNNIENETKKRKQIANIADKYSSASLAEDLEEEFKRQTVGLVSAADFKAKRQAIDDMIRETQQAEKEKKNLRVKRTVKAAQLSFEADDIAGSDDDEEQEASASDDEIKIRKKRFGKNPTAKTDFLYDADREAELLRKKKRAHCPVQEGARGDKEDEAGSDILLLGWLRSSPELRHRARLHNRKLPTEGEGRAGKKRLPRASHSGL